MMIPLFALLDTKKTEELLTQPTGAMTTPMSGMGSLHVCTTCFVCIPTKKPHLHLRAGHTGGGDVRSHNL